MPIKNIDIVLLGSLNKILIIIKVKVIIPKIFISISKATKKCIK